MDAIETIRANVSPVVLSAIDGSDDDDDDDNDDDNEKEEEDEVEEDGNASEGDGNGDDWRWLDEDIKKDVNISYRFMNTQ